MTSGAIRTASQLRDVDDLVVEREPAAAGHEHVDLLLLGVAVAERHALIRLHALEAEGELRRVEVVAYEARLHDVAHAELLGAVLDVL